MTDCRQNIREEVSEQKYELEQWPFSANVCSLFMVPKFIPVSDQPEMLRTSHEIIVSSTSDFIVHSSASNHIDTVRLVLTECFGYMRQYVDRSDNFLDEMTWPCRKIFQVVKLVKLRYNPLLASFRNISGGGAYIRVYSVPAVNQRNVCRYVTRNG